METSREPACGALLLLLLVAATGLASVSAAVDGAPCHGGQYFDQLTRACASCELRCSKPPKACVAHCSAPSGSDKPSAVLIGGLVAGVACLLLLLVVVLGVICRERIGGVIRIDSSDGNISTDSGNKEETTVMIGDVLSTSVVTPVQDTEVSPIVEDTSSTSGSQETSNWLEGPSELVVG
ncbi:tumor necrosis factor receptor superfamily member 17 isoform X2 [Petromyzon marinus]|uniref:B-cell maturation antigen-like 1 n=1 Tax=Petromyzon marinus TaxID=7757 RepID=A0A5Q0MUN3_PETMA|nr:tumor necrosis factor receptor superfamily member 17-like isoform X2 [Petromyzon marinus]QFZ95510.1 B-cell maturation antigen-like 1 [Petromyzon marinus]